MATLSEFVSVHLDPGHPGVGTLVLSRPPTNALTRQVYREIEQAAAEVSEHDGIAAVILFGGHEIFSAGDDMPQLRTLTLIGSRELAARAPRRRRRRRGDHRSRPSPRSPDMRWERAWVWRWPPTGG